MRTRHECGNGDDFDLNKVVEDILSWAGQYADERGICPYVLSELLATAAAKLRILTHYEEEHGGAEGIEFKQRLTVQRHGQQHHSEGDFAARRCRVKPKLTSGLRVQRGAVRLLRV